MKRITSTLLVLGCLTWIESSTGALYTESCNATNHNKLDIHIPDANLVASSSSDKTHKPARGRLNQLASGRQASAWCAGDQNKDQWLAVDLVGVRKVTHIATQGQYDPKQESGHDVSWVTEYTLEYSVDNKTYYRYNFGYNSPLVFKGNSDGNMTECRVLPYPINVQYIRILPRAWEKKICLRLGVFGSWNGTANYAGPALPTAPSLHHTSWWIFFWCLIALLVLATIIFLFLYCCYIRKRQVPRHKVSTKRLKAKPIPRRSTKQAYSNEAYDMTVITQSHTTTVVMPEEAEEAEEDEVQEVTAEFTADEVDNKRGIIGFSVADEDDDAPSNDDIHVPNGNAPRDSRAGHDIEDIERQDRRI